MTAPEAIRLGSASRQVERVGWVCVLPFLPRPIRPAGRLALETTTRGKVTGWQHN